MQLPEVIYEDRHLVAVNKPARIPVASENSGDLTLLDMVREWNRLRQGPGKKGYCVPIHFLDRPVSGIILFALSSKAAARLNQFFRERSIQKTYFAIVHCSPDSLEGTLEHWLIKDREANISKVVSKSETDAKKCVLNFRILERGIDRSAIAVYPSTGRSHQIRAQFAAIGCPLIGDVKYGAKHSWEGRVSLHAQNLAFPHPVGGKPTSLSVEIPDYWCEIWSGEFPKISDIH
jgi:23S rRNA pseudouridine1911/1915/1917 synthase